MSRLAGLALLLPPLFLFGCAEEAPPPEITSRPVKLYTVEGPGDQAIRNFPGSVNATQRADLSFRVPGMLQQILVREGENVSKGQLLATLDPTDYEIVLEDRQATFDNAQRNFERAKELITDGNISKLDYDRMEANFRTAAAALAKAEQDLEYTQLRAPFDGTIARREVDNFEEVVAKQTIFRFANLSRMDIVINLPEAFVRSIRARSDDFESGQRIDQNERDVTALASFEGRENSSFTLKLKEVATKADPQTQTFAVTFTMPQPDNFRVLPGMTANVLVDFSRIIAMDFAKWVPVSAVQADADLDPRVWMLEPETMTVKSHPVTLGRMSGDRVEVLDGLAGGEEIVSVGAAYLSEGMRVTRMQTGEQAVPREDDA
ncbi:MAG: efflux RND transporter periplasmic adaptor subunit [Halieaceae bacterium]|jgi:RND family efflux transporter MFP subunit|nr:efflux RND transporter periplasmic adaptor subunit [Halieaceae bacterium]